MSSKSKLPCTLYRLFLRHANRMEKEVIDIQMNMPMDKSAWMMHGGGHGWISPHPEYSVEAVKKTLPWLDQTFCPHGKFSSSEMKAYVRQSFRHPSKGLGHQELVDRAFDSLRVLEEQLYMNACSSTAITRGVRIDVTSAYVGTQKDIDDTYDEAEDGPLKHFYTYRIRVSNNGSSTVQLLSRHWEVKNSQGKLVAEVAKGARGVVGCTPILKPGTCFCYYSGTDMDSQGGSMAGSFGMATLDSKGSAVDSFDATIAPFKFITLDKSG